MTTDAQFVRSSFDAIASQGDQFTDRFFQHFFEAAPQVHSLFPSDMTQLKNSLWSTIGLVAKNADNLSALSGQFADMGTNHAGYGVKPEYYAVFCETLVATFAEFSGTEWNNEFEGAWTRVFDSVTQMMFRGIAKKAA